MKTVLIVLGVVVGLIALVVVLLVLKAIAGGKRAYAKLLSRIAPVTGALAAGREPAAADLQSFASDRTTRAVLHDVLTEAGKVSLFPSVFMTWEAMAEAHLVRWLCHPNELGAPPDEIELMAKLPAPGQPSLHCFVFRYRVQPPHWGASNGWMAGVAGPFDLAQTPVPYGSGTFSRFEAFDSRTPEEHAAVTLAKQS